MMGPEDSERLKAIRLAQEESPDTTTGFLLNLLDEANTEMRRRFYIAESLLVEVAVLREQIRGMELRKIIGTETK